MSEILKQTIVDIETNTVKNVALTADEIIAHNQRVAEQEQMVADLEAAKNARETLISSARAKLVAGTPLTEEEAAVLAI
jgi:hypothetical protein